jgi:hypothetical protein
VTASPANPESADSGRPSRERADSFAELKQLYERANGLRAERGDQFMKERAIGRELYADETGKPELRKSFAVLIDELGTSERLKSYTNEQLLADLGRYDSARLALYDPNDRSRDLVRAMYFTDNVLLAMPEQAMDLGGDHSLGFAVAVAADYQLELALGGRFTRGGIAYGPLYADNSLVIGLPVVVAHHLEEKVTKMPRVILDNASIRFARRERMSLRSGGLATSDVEEYLLVDENYSYDGEKIKAKDVVFVGYLRGLLASGPLGQVWEIGKALALHAEHIRSNLAQPEQRPDVTEKYEWLAWYHDYFVTQVAWYPEHLIGAEPMGQLRPLTTRVDWFGERIGQQAAKTFRHQATAFESAWYTNAGRPTVAELLRNEFPTLCELSIDTRWLGMALHTLCLLRDALLLGQIPKGHRAPIAELVDYSDRILRALPYQSGRVDGLTRSLLPRQTEMLADALRLVREHPRYWRVLQAVILQLAKVIPLDPTRGFADPT